MELGTKLDSLSHRTLSVAIASMCLIGFLFQAAYYYPGGISHDAEVAFRAFIENRQDDWHSPLLSVWQLLFDLSLPSSTYPAGPAFSVTAMFWLGLWLFSTGLLTYGRIAAPLIPLIGWFPPLFMFMPVFGKDSILVACFTLCIGCSMHIRRADGHKIMWLVMIGLCCLAAITIRTNSIFAVLPLLFFAISRTIPLTSFFRHCVATLAIWFALLGMSQVITYNLLKAEKSYSLQYVIISDLFALNLVRDEFVLPDILLENTPALTEQVFRDRHTMTPKVDWALWGERDINLYMVSNEAEFQALRDFWLDRVIADPSGYIEVKVEFFSQLMSNKGNSLYRWLLFHGWVYLIVLVTIGLWFCARLLRRNTGVLNQLGTALAASGLLYLLPYTLLQGGANFRFLLWTIGATALMGVTFVASILSKRQSDTNNEGYAPN